MKSRFVGFVGVFCIAGLIVSGAYADKPDNPGKPGKPQNPGTPTDLIIFEGDLEGQAIVENCCPNAGPNPAYILTVTSNLGDEVVGPHVPAGDYEGFIFMNVFGTRKNRQYYVKFWGSSPSTPGLNIAIGIKGGTFIQHDKKSRILEVDFNGDLLYTLDSNGVLDQIIDTVNFKLIRTQL